MRPIDADALKEHMFYHSTDNTMYLEERDIDEAPTVAASPWHRVEEPPKEEGRYLVWDVDGFAYCDTWKDDKWQIASSVPETNISHWMPIEPPKEDA